MSDYDELKKEMNRINRAISNKHHEIQKISDELAAIEQEKEAAKSNSDSKLHSDYQEKYKQHLNSILGPIDQNIARVKKEIEEEDASFKDDFAELTEEKFMEACMDTQQLLRQLQEMSTKLSSQLQDLVGPRLYNNVSNNLRETNMKLGVDDLNRAITYFNECEEKTTRMLERPDYVGNGIKNLENKLASFELGTTDSKGAMIFLAIALLLVFFVLYKFVFPVYIVFVCLIGTFHVFRTYSVYEVLLVQKSIIDNIDAIKAKLHEEAKEAAASARAELQQEHQAKADQLQQELQALMEKQINATNASKASFSYDGALIKNALEGTLVNLEKREADAVSNKMLLQKALDDLMKSLTDVKVRMEAVFSSQQNEFLNFEKAGESFILDRQFLLDIDDITKKLTFFTFPETSTMFVYRDRSEAVNFIKLINAQIRSRLHPLAYEVVFYDAVSIGQDCFFFVPETKGKGDTASRLFKIVSIPQDYQEVIKQYTSEMKSRQKSFGQDKSLDEYNERMRAIDSVAIPYLFSFVLDPDDSLVQKMGVATRAAGNYGIYIWAFIEEAQLLKLGSSARKTIEMFESFFVIQNNNVNSRAKSFLLSEYCDKKS